MEIQARLKSRQKSILDKWAKTSTGQRVLDGVIDYDKLPEDLRNALERGIGMDTETLWRDAERYLEDLAVSARFGSEQKELTAASAGKFKVEVQRQSWANHEFTVEGSNRREAEKNAIREAEGYGGWSEKGADYSVEGVKKASSRSARGAEHVAAPVDQEGLGKAIQELKTLKFPKYKEDDRKAYDKAKKSYWQGVASVCKKIEGMARGKFSSVKSTAKRLQKIADKEQGPTPDVIWSVMSVAGKKGVTGVPPTVVKQSQYMQDMFDKKKKTASDRNKVASDLVKMAKELAAGKDVKAVIAGARKTLDNIEKYLKSAEKNPNDFRKAYFMAEDFKGLVSDLKSAINDAEGGGW